MIETRTGTSPFVSGESTLDEREEPSAVYLRFATRRAGGATVQVTSTLNTLFAIAEHAYGYAGREYQDVLIFANSARDPGALRLGDAIWVPPLSVPREIRNATLLWGREPVLSDPFRAPFAQGTFDIEGSEQRGPNFSRAPHVPGSRVTVGRGYDLGLRNAAEVEAQLMAAGVPRETARALAGGAGIQSASEARAFAARSARHVLSPEQQWHLFVQEYVRQANSALRDLARFELGRWVRVVKGYVEKAKRAGTTPDRATIDACFAKAIDLGTLDPLSVEVLVDLKYRGDLTPEVWERLRMRVNDVYALREDICRSENWPGVYDQVYSRFAMRCRLVGAIAAPKLTPIVPAPTREHELEPALEREEGPEHAAALLRIPAISWAPRVSSGADGDPRPMVDRATSGRAGCSCAGGGPQALAPGMLRALSALTRPPYSFSFRISSLAGGRHPAGSPHQQGRAFDIDTLNGARIDLHHAGVNAFSRACRDLGAVELFGPWLRGYDGHVHAAWPVEAEADVEVRSCESPMAHQSDQRELFEPSWAGELETPPRLREEMCVGAPEREAPSYGPPSRSATTIVGSTFNVVDPVATIRSGAPSFAPTKGVIGRGAAVVVKNVGVVGDTVYVEVSGAGLAAGTWTKLTNLDVPMGAVLAKIPASADPNDHMGTTAAWDDGRFIGQIELLDVIGTGRVKERVSAQTYPYFQAMARAAEAEKVALTINSGFRTYAEQKYFWDLFNSGKGERAAKPGYSNHQHGQAFDINTGMGSGNPTAPTSAWSAEYRWLVGNAGRFGFQRTVEGEPWHWEYRPSTAANDPVFGNKALLLAQEV